MSTSRPQPSAATPDHDADPVPAPPGSSATPTTEPPADDGDHAGDDAPVVRAMDVAHPSTVRRAPRYGRFGMIGFLLGVIASLVLALVGVSDFSTRDVFLVLLIGLGTAGIFGGLLVALVSDRRSMRRRD